MSECSFTGSLDVYAQPAFERVLRELSGRHIVIDLTSVRFVSAAFIGALVRLRRRMPASEIKIVGANAFVRRIFHVVALDDAFAFAPAA